MRERKPRRGFCQRGGKALIDHAHETAGTREIGVVGQRGPDWLGRRTGDWMALGRSGQRAAREDADADHADVCRARMIEQPSIVLRRIVRRQSAGSGRVEHVIDHLRAVEDARIDHLMQRRRIADGSQPKETRLALLAQAIEGRHHLAQCLRNAECFSAALLGDRVVQVEDIDPFELQACQAGFERLGYGICDAPELAARTSACMTISGLGR